MFKKILLNVAYEVVVAQRSGYPHVVERQMPTLIAKGNFAPGANSVQVVPAT